MAVDFQSIKNDYYGGQAEILTWPMAPMFKDAYTPLNELPQSARELFEYHPDKAKQLLAEAGYPKGFKTEIVTTQSYVDILSVIKDYWAAIGVDLVLDVKDAGVWDSVGRAHTYKEMLMSYKGLGSADIFTDLRPGISGNYSIVNDPYINERWAKIKSWGTDDPVRNRLSKEITLYTLSEIVPYVQMPLPYYHTIWWPWVKNYHGETAIGYYDSPDFHKYIWIDEAMKREKMGGG